MSHTAKRSIKNYLLVFLLGLSLSPLAIVTGIGLFSIVGQLGNIEEQYEGVLLEQRVSPVQDQITTYKTLGRFISQLPAVAEIMGRGKTREGSIEKQRAVKRYSGVIKRAFSKLPSIVAVRLYDDRGRERLHLNRNNGPTLQSASGDTETADTRGAGSSDILADVMQLPSGEMLILPMFSETSEHGASMQRRLLLRMYIPIEYQETNIGVYTNDIDMGLLSRWYPNIAWAFDDGTYLEGRGSVFDLHPQTAEIFASGKPAVCDGKPRMAWIPLYTDETGTRKLWAGQEVRLAATSSTQRLWVGVALVSVLFVGILVAFYINLIAGKARAFFTNALDCVESAVLKAKPQVGGKPTGLREVDAFLERIDALVTEQRRIERLKEDVERIIRHDLRTPLNGIVGVCNYLLEEEIAEDQRQLLTMARESSYATLRMINLSKDLYKMESGTYQFEPKCVALSPVLSQVIEHSESLARARDVNIVVDNKGSESSSAHELMLQADELLLYSALGNLLTNALEASPTGAAVHIDITTDESCHISISNEGGVPEEIRERFFEKYTTHGKKSGTGLGTYSARLSIETMGGEISMQSDADHTVISMVLPLAT